MIMKRYTSEFYDKQVFGSVKSAETVLAKIFSVLSPSSCVDYGCGVGAWLSVCKKLGATVAVGYDGAYVDKSRLLIDQSEFKAVDLETLTRAKGCFDLAISVEVAEHLSESSSDNFVSVLTGASDVVLFSAAIPGQGGVRHINEQWQSYWVNKFVNAGFVPTKYIKQNFWNNEDVEYWYRQNCILFVQKAKLAHVSKLNSCGVEEDFGPFDVVHPKQFEYYVRRGVAEVLMSSLRSLKY